MSFDAIPIWAIFLATLIVILAALESGFRIGRRRSAGGGKSDVSSAMVGACMGLLAFMMAFTFNAAASRHEARRMLVIEDANAIEKVWLRAGFLADAPRAEVRQLVGEYVDLRVEAAADRIDVPTALKRSAALQERLWELATVVGRNEPGSIMSGLFVESLNEMIDVQLKSLTVGARARVAPTIWFALYALAALGMAMMGIQNGLGGARQTGIGLMLALSFSIVLFVIADLDRPQQGIINVSQQPILDLQRNLRSRH